MSSQASNRAVSPLQPCPHCKTSANVALVRVSGIEPGVQYFVCKTCGKVFGSRFGTIEPSHHSSKSSVA